MDCIVFICLFFFSHFNLEFLFKFFSDIIHGKLDQKNKQLEVDYAIGRDIRTEDVKKISATLQEWCDSCESVLHTIENQIDRANSAKSMRTKHTEDLESEVCLHFFYSKIVFFFVVLHNRSVYRLQI